VPDRDDGYDDDRPRRRRDEDDDYDRPRRPSGGGGGTTIALVIGAILLIGLCVVAGLGALLWPAISKVRDAAARLKTSNNLKQLALGMHNHASATDYMPTPALQTADGGRGLSWRVGLLPYIEQDSLYRQFRLGEPWDSPANRRFVELMPKIYLTEGDPELRPGTDLTRFRVFVGGGAMFEWNKKTKLSGREDEKTAVITDGTSNTIMIAEAADPVTWTKPEELAYSPNGPLPRLGPPHRDLALVAMADGSVRPMKKTISESTLRALITRGGNEVVPPDW
jgi:hypothetical protein